MATTTPNFGWPVPTSTDLVKDGATAIEALGDGVDASLVDLKGGTTGQVLAKASNTDMDFSWVAQDDSNAIQNAIVDAKGDIIAATAADTPARLAVGANDYFLQAASGESTGLKWGGTYTSWTPTVTQSGSVTVTVNFAKYIKIGKFVSGYANLTVTGTGTALNNIVISVPLTAANASSFATAGVSTVFDSSANTVYPGLLSLPTTTTFQLPVANATALNGLQNLGYAQFSAALASSDQIGFSFQYEVA